MSDLPKFVTINEEGPREGFQIEKGPISTAQKLELIDALSATGVGQIQVVSYVNPDRVPGMADADAVVAGYKRKPGVRYTALWLNAKGFERAVASGRIDAAGSLSLTASEAFLQRNQRRTLADNLAEQRRMISLYREHNLPIRRGAIMAAFGCNYQGEIAPGVVIEQITQMMQLGEEFDFNIEIISLADTMAWATPTSVRRLVGEIRNRYPDLRLALHLHDTRGMGIANAYAGVEMGVDTFDSAVGGLGGCPFAAHSGAAGNVCTEDLVFMLHEMGIETGIDLDKLIEAARLAEIIVGHPLPGAVKLGGNLQNYRKRAS